MPGKRLYLPLVLMLALSLFSQTAFAETSPTPIIGKGGLAQGYVTVAYKPASGVKAIVRVAKGAIQYDYALTNGSQYPLQLGNGSYTVLVAEAVNAKQYKVVAQETFEVKLTDDKQVFTLSNPLINWTKQNLAVKKAAELTANLKTDQQKTQAIYNYITKTFKYDETKAKNVAQGYVPNLDSVFKTSGGICYDYAATFAAMARSVGIPTKLVIGRERSQPKVEHAWNEVYIKELKKWVTLDTTYDAARVQAGQKPGMFKAAGDYTGSKFY